MRSFLTLMEIARILGRSLPDTRKVLSRSRLSHRMISGERHWVRDEVLHWLEQEFDSLTVDRLRDMDLAGEAATGLSSSACFLSDALSPQTVHPWVNANTASSMLRRLSELAVETGRTWDRRAFCEELERREEAGSTALANMTAFPHPRDVRRLYLEDDILLLARTHHGIPFGAEKGRLTSLFFLLAYRRPDAHLHVLARLNRMIRRDGFVKALLDAEDTVDMLELIRARECEIVEENR
jgi:mannitol/fructose-specific phosphotransferase system IIA component (Ntr-type)